GASYLTARHSATCLPALSTAWPLGFSHPATLVRDAERRGVPIRPIDVARSGWMRRWEARGVRLGMRFVKGLSEAAGRAIEEEQAKGPFRDADELARRCRLAPAGPTPPPPARAPPALGPARPRA